jgi:hypothetical protein
MEVPNGNNNVVMYCYVWRSFLVNKAHVIM